jgi:hypothetical protein
MKKQTEIIIAVDDSEKFRIEEDIMKINGVIHSINSEIYNKFNQDVIDDLSSKFKELSNGILEFFRESVIDKLYSMIALEIMTAESCLIRNFIKNEKFNKSIDVDVYNMRNEIFSCHENGSEDMRFNLIDFFSDSYDDLFDDEKDEDEIKENISDLWANKIFDRLYQENSFQAKLKEFLSHYINELSYKITALI